MISSYDKLYDNLCRALDEASNEPLTSNSLDNIFKLINSLYKLDKMDTPNYSYGGGSSYANGRGQRNGRYSYDNRYRNGYSRHNKEDIKEELYKLMQDSDDEDVREKIQEWLRNMDR